MWTGVILETPAKDIHDAIDECETNARESELSNAHKAQLAAARKAAHDLIDAEIVKGESFEVLLGGHADPGDGNTQADYVHVQVTQRPAQGNAAPEVSAELAAEADRPEV